MMTFLFVSKTTKKMTNFVKTLVPPTFLRQQFVDINFEFMFTLCRLWVFLSFYLNSSDKCFDHDIFRRPKH